MGEHGKPLGQPEVIASLQDLVKVLAPWIEDKLLEARIKEAQKIMYKQNEIHMKYMDDINQPYKLLKVVEDRISKLTEERGKDFYTESHQSGKGVQERQNMENVVKNKLSNKE